MNLKDQLIRDECGSLSKIPLKPYRDTVGKLTIGIGRNLDDRGITYDEALYMFQNDIDWVTEEVDKTLPWLSSLSEARKAVVYNMAFNMGLPSLLRFKRMLTAMKEGNFDEAGAALLDSKYATQVGPRAQRLAAQLTLDQWM